MIRLTILFFALNASNCPVPSPTFVNDNWNTDFGSVDFSHPSKRPALVDHKIVEFFDAEHFDWLLQNLDDVERPNSLIAFWNSSDSECVEAYRSSKFETTSFASRDHLLIGVHDTSPRAQRSWYVHTPEMDLQARFGLDTSRSCPEFVFVSHECNGMTEWCVGEELQPGVHRVGCNNFTACERFAIFPKGSSTLLQFRVREHMRLFGVPSKVGKNRQYQSRTQTTVTRNNFVPPAVPKFSFTGFKVMKIPSKMYLEMLEFQKKWEHMRYEEHEVFGIIKGAKTYMVKLDNDIPFRQRIATEYMQPILESWTGLDLTYESFYGVREYRAGAMLRNHVDRLKTHVISATMNVGPPDLTSEWPIEVITHNGVRVRYNHPPGSMVLYESTTLIHGRPYPLPASQGSHFGAFIHFSPRPWDDAGLRDNIAKHTTSMPIFEDELASLVIDAKASYMESSAANLPQNIRIYNFGAEDLEQFWVKNKHEFIPMGGVESGKYSDLTSYIGHEFAFRPFGSEEIVHRHKVRAGKFVDVISPGNECRADNPECRRIGEHMKFQDEYFHRTGMPYMAPTVRPSTKTFMWPANYIGEAHKVETEFGFCDDLDCEFRESQNFSLITVATSPRVFFIDSLVNEFERQHILKVALSRQTRSTVGNGKYGGMTQASRSSKTAWIPHTFDKVLHNVCKRMMKLLNLDESALLKTEQLQVVQYLKEEKYDNHVDFSFESGNPRFATFGIYLKSPEKGGYTGFPRAFEQKGLKVKPQTGGAVLFYSLLEDGNGDANSVHAGMPVEKGEKQFANLWIHEQKF